MLFLHIGRGKSGSATIQSLAEEHGELLASRGIACPPSKHRSVSHAPLARALAANAPDRTALERFKAFLQSNPLPHTLISSEFLLRAGPSAAERLKSALAGRPTRVICYIREYPAWIVSKYAQATKTGRNSLDFDEFFERTLVKTPVLDQVAAWGDTFGWENMYLRTLQPSVLKEGDLIADFMAALDLPDVKPKVASKNLAPPWYQLEFTRAYVATNGSKIRKLQAERPAIVAFAAAAAAAGASRQVQYITPKQWLRAADLFNAEMAVLGEKTRQQFPVLEGPPGERPFLPTLDAVPVAAREQFIQELSGIALKSRLGSDAIERFRDVPGLAA